MTPQQACATRCLLCKHLDHRTLAGTGFAAHEHDLAGSRSHRAQVLRKILELGVAFQEVHTRSMG